MERLSCRRITLRSITLRSIPLSDHGGRDDNLAVSWLHCGHTCFHRDTERHADYLERRRPLCGVGGVQRPRIFIAVRGW